jgi:hypothetical protein
MTNSHKDCFSKSSLHVCQGQTDQLPIHFLYTPHPSFQLHHYSNSLLPVSLHPGNIASLNRYQQTLQVFRAVCDFACVAVADSNTHRLTRAQSVRAQPKAIIHRRIPETSIRMRTTHAQEQLPT